MVKWIAQKFKRIHTNNGISALNSVHITDNPKDKPTDKQIYVYIFTRHLLNTPTPCKLSNFKPFLAQA